MVVSLIVAASQNNVIGKGGAIPWKLPAEQAYFREVTRGHPIIMGRKTYESIGRALPGRQNIIITRNKGYRAEGCEIVYSLKEALDLAKDAGEVFIIGGSQIYKESLPLADRLYLTRIEAKIEGDSYFKFNESDWNIISSKKYPSDKENPLGYTTYVMARKKQS